MAEISYINTSEIYPHPKNPRKEIGDVSELTESIKHSGILQNLTVVKGHFLTDEEFGKLAKEYANNPSEELRDKINSKKSPEGYTVIIGHRRLAAAKGAGLSAIPCTVSDMDEKEQLSTMITENMQRTDLTVYEQAQGFQTMLDLGETEDTISQRTGFSRGTVRHRLNLAKLDPELLKDKEKSPDFQLTLKDLYKLEKLKDEKDRNLVLKKARSSRDIDSEVESFLRNKTAKENEKELRRIFKENGIKEAPKNVSCYSNGYETLLHVLLYNADIESAQVKISKLKDKEKLIFLFQYNRAYILRPQGKKKLSPYEQNMKEQEKKRRHLNLIGREIREVFKTFLHKRIDEKPYEENPEVFKKLWNAAVKNSLCIYEIDMLSFISGKEYYNMSPEEREAAEAKKEKLSLVNQLLILIAESSPLYEVCNVNLKPIDNHINMLMTLHEEFFAEGFILNEEQLAVITSEHEHFERGNK